MVSGQPASIDVPYALVVWGAVATERVDYEHLGRTYAIRRVADPRIAARIHAGRARAVSVRPSTGSTACPTASDAPSYNV